MRDTRRRFLKLLGLGALTPCVTPATPIALPPAVPPQVIDAYKIPVKFRTHDALWLEVARAHALKNDNVRAAT